jgi:checkpoint serine/threonine-protein kinase
VNEKTGRAEYVMVDLEAIYPENDPDGRTEYSFEELIAKRRGWTQEACMAVVEQIEENSKPQKKRELQVFKDQTVVTTKTVPLVDHNDSDAENIPPQEVKEKPVNRHKKVSREDKANRTLKIEVMEVKQKPQTGKSKIIFYVSIATMLTDSVAANLDSPTGPKIKRKKSAEPTVTLCTREAMDEIYDILSQPLKPSQNVQDDQSEAESTDDEDYTSGGESTTTGRISATASEFGDTTVADFTVRSETAVDVDEDEIDDGISEADADVRSVSDWSDFTASKHVPKGDRVEKDDKEGDEDEEEQTSTTSTTAADSTKVDEEDAITTPTSPEQLQEHPLGRYVPIQPEDCDIPRNPYRDPSYVAQSRLPFMTPIVEKTESSIGAATAFSKKDYFNMKTPSKAKSPTKGAVDAEPWSSPFDEDTENVQGPVEKVQPPALKKETQVVLPMRAKEPVVNRQPLQSKGPIINYGRCNPIDTTIRNTILAEIQPPLASYDGYFDRSHAENAKGMEIRKFIRSTQKNNRGEKTATVYTPPVLSLEGSERIYTVKRELGKGAFAPVYLVESKPAKDEEEDEEAVARMGKGAFGVSRNDLEAIKAEDNPPSAWEFYMLRQAKRRLGVSRPVESIIQVYEMHLFKNEGYMVEEYRDQGTLLDLVNILHDKNCPTSDAEKELVAMFFTIELLRTTEALHIKGLLHGDIKADNLLVRFASMWNDEEWTSQYVHDGTNGWSDKGITMIDFGRGIDMKAFISDVQFEADWQTSEADCTEMREMRPWTFQVDYHGIAGVAHNLLFGKYMQTIAEGRAALGAGQTKKYRIREGLKRYWQSEIWSEVFDLMLNPLMHLEGEETKKLPVTKGMKSCREKMETWLEGNCSQGVGLKALLRRLETSLREKRK